MTTGHIYDRDHVRACRREHRLGWRVLQRHGGASAFNGYRWRDSAYSLIRCTWCGREWRTKAAYVEQLEDAAR